jgi:hypothetical protein
MMTPEEKIVRMKLVAALAIAAMAGGLVVFGFLDGAQWLTAVKAVFAL